MEADTIRPRLNDEGLRSSGPFSPRNDHPLMNASVANLSNQMKNPSAGVRTLKPPTTSRSRPVNREPSKSKIP